MTRVPKHDVIVREILEAIGSQPDLLIFKRPVGSAITDAGNRITYGIKGEPDLQGYIKPGIPFHLEVKSKTDRLRPDQITMHALLRSFGVLVYVVRSADEAVSALADVRKIRDAKERA
jgi:hypothetical protein